MTEALYATIGRKQEELDNLNSEYDRLLSLLSGVLSGDIDMESVSVNLELRSWAIDRIDGEELEETTKEYPVASKNDQELV